MYIEKIIAEDLGLSVPYISSVLSRVNSLYNKFNVDGRLICSPKIELRLIQTWIANFVRVESECLPTYITAYENGSSIMKNAAMHAHNPHMLCLDIKGFFRSCSSEKVSRVFESLRITEREGCPRRLAEDDIAMLTELSCIDGSLPMGAPSSPFLANRIMVPIDQAIRSILPEDSVYTRYSDDICISSAKRIEIEAVITEIEKVLVKNGFSLNRRKVRCGGRGDRRKITGIYVTSEGLLSIGKERKRQIKSDLYRVLMQYCPISDVYKVWGELNFCKQVNSEYFNSLVAKYSNYGRAAEYGGVIPALRSMMKSNS